MAKFAIYHFDSKRFQCFFGKWKDADTFEDIATPTLDQYRFVGVVDANDPEDVFRITNHIDSDWTTNPEVDIAMGRCRSTSVGDIIVNLNTVESFLCASIGWEKIGNEVAA